MQSGARARLADIEATSEVPRQRARKAVACAVGSGDRRCCRVRGEADAARARLDVAASLTFGHHERSGRDRVISQRAGLSRIAATAHDDIGPNSGAREGFAATGGDDEQPSRPRRDERLRVLAREVRRVAGREGVPGQWIITSRMERLADDEDRTLCAGRQHDQIARLRDAAAPRVDAGARCGQPCLDHRGRIIVSEGGEEVNLAIASGELREGNAATTAGNPLGRFEMRDIARCRKGWQAANDHVLDVANHRDAEPGGGRSGHGVAAV